MDENKIREIRKLCLSAKLTNQTVGKELDKNPPQGWMPPEKRQKIMDIFTQIEQILEN